MLPNANQYNESDAEGLGLKIQVIGLGGAGTNAIDGLELEGLGSVALLAVNTDAQALDNSPVGGKLLIGRSVTRGLSAGGDIEIGKAAAEADRAELAALVEGMDLVLLVVGLGGGTGSALAPIMAELATEAGALVLAFATLPFTFEGGRRKQIAEDSLMDLRKRVHGLIPLPNDVLLQESEENSSVLSAFSVADQWIGRGVQSICSMLLKTGLINQDFSSLRSVFPQLGGKTIFGIGFSEGGEAIEKALEDLTLCPLLHLGDRPAHLDRLLVNVIGGADLQISQINQIVSEITKRFGSREDIVFGAVIDEQRAGSVEICLFGRSGLESSSSVSGADDALSFNEPEEGSPLPTLSLETEITKDNKSPRAVHKSKLRGKKKETPVDQDEFTFIEENAHRGYFDNTDRNLYNDEDLDVPTYLRKGIKIKIKT
ncbi:MAG: cell division protein FtsZ [Coraliomargaritaceae bacterium]